MRRLWTPTACALLALQLLPSQAAIAAMPRSFVPADDAVILQAAWRGSDPALQALEALRTAWQARPNNATAAEAYARAAIEQGRQRADPRYFGYAEAALAHWESPAAPAAIVWLQATLLQQRHQFDAAAALLDTLLQREPGYAPARLTRASIRLVQGRPREAQQDCAALASIGGLNLATACAAAAASLMGRGESALGSLDAIAPQFAASPAAERSWALTLAAEIAARRGDADDAQRRYDLALRSASEAGFVDPYLRVSYADFLLAQQRPQQVVDLLSRETHDDNALLRLTIAQSRLPKQRARSEQLTTLLEARYAAVRERGEQPHLREEALLQLDLRQAPKDALRTALYNWRIQREPIDARLVLEAALAAHDATAARPVIDWMRDTGIDDAALLRLAVALGAQP